MRKEDLKAHVKSSYTVTWKGDRFDYSYPDDKGKSVPWFAVIEDDKITFGKGTGDEIVYEIGDLDILDKRLKNHDVPKKKKLESFKKFVATEETLDSFAAKAWKAGDPKLKKDIQKILSEKEGYKVTTSISTLGGADRPSFSVSYWNINDAKGNIKQNSTAHTILIMHTDKNNKVWKWEMATAHFKQKQNGIKFRALRSTKSMDDANAKLLAWIKKNKPDLDALRDGK